MRSGARAGLRGWRAATRGACSRRGLGSAAREGRRRASTSRGSVASGRWRSSSARGGAAAAAARGVERNTTATAGRRRPGRLVGRALRRGDASDIAPILTKRAAGREAGRLSSSACGSRSSSPAIGPLAPAVGFGPSAYSSARARSATTPSRLLRTAVPEPRPRRGRPRVSRALVLAFRGCRRGRCPSRAASRRCGFRPASSGLGGGGGRGAPLPHFELVSSCARPRPRGRRGRISPPVALPRELPRVSASSASASRASVERAGYGSRGSRSACSGPSRARAVRPRATSAAASGAASSWSSPRSRPASASTRLQEPREHRGCVRDRHGRELPAAP